ncbi:MAG: S9 family peptidase [Rubrivivax sp.]
MKDRARQPTRPATPLAIDDLWQLDRLAAAGLSPDGRQAVCTVMRGDLEANRSRSSLWLLDAQGRRPPRRLTTADGRHAQPAWSPRGDRIAFVASREQQGRKDEEPQLYLIAPDGGEARRASQLAAGVEAFRWLPDGRGVLCSAWVWPELKGTAAQARRHQAWRERKESGYATEEAQYRHWDHNHPQGRVRHLLRLDLADSGRGRVQDLFEGTAWELPRSDGTADGFDVSPDGRRVAFCCDPAAVKLEGNRQIVVEMDLATRRTRVLADDAEWSFDWPRYAPDGRRLLVAAARTGADPTAPWRPALITLAGRQPGWRPLAQRWDHEMAAPGRWAADGASFLLSAERQGRCPLWRCTPDDDDGRFEVIADPGWVQGFDLAGDAEAPVLLTLVDRASHPPQVWVQRGADAPRRIESFNDRRLARHALGRSEAVTIAGAQGDPLQLWLTYPPGFDRRRRHPLLHVVHGGPFAAAGDTWGWRWNTHVLASQGHVVVQVNYHGSSGFGHAFKRSITGRLGALEFQDIEAASDWLLQQPWADGRRLFAAGGSYGGFLTAWLNGHAAPGRYRALVCHAGVFDRVATFAADSWATRRHDLGGWYWDDLPRVLRQSPHAAAGGMVTPTLVTHGALDYRVPDANGLALYNTLKARGVDARLLWFPDENHWVLKPRNSRQWHQEVLSWLQRHGRP